MQKQIKQYSSQPGGSTKPKANGEENFVIAGSEPEVANGVEQDGTAQTLGDKSAQKVSTISSLGASTKSGAENRR